MNIELIIFLIFSVLVLISAIGVVHNNPVKSAINLVSFFFISQLYFVLNAEFLSIILILVYGAVMVLFLFCCDDVRY